MPDERKPFRMCITETRQYEFEVWAADEDEARESGQKIWRKANTVSQWETGAIEYEYEVSPIAYEPHAQPSEETDG